MNIQNVSKQMDHMIQLNTEQGIVPTLLLHSCCAPCSSYVLEYLGEHFKIYDYFYNPNITNAEEYALRKDEMIRFIQAFPNAKGVTFLDVPYDPSRYLELVKGFENCKEGGERCAICFAMRLEESAKKAKELGCDYFATTLTISPLKNAEKINEIGRMLGEKYGVSYLPSDFKKKNGYKRSVELSSEYDLYRQQYCGCEFSKGEAYGKEV